ncbi:MAG: CrcB family protein [Halobacteriales archaeon]|nr:CrcB family protein [Halobacteriales archaeon]
MDSEPTLTFVAVGGALGAVCRWGVGVALAGPAFPIGTLVVNVVGAFLLGVLLYERRLRNAFSSRTRLVAGTGFLSSFTTYSTFAAESVALDPALVGLNLTANYAFGFIAVVAGRSVARWLS